MATFMDVHSGFVGVTAEQLKAAHEADLAIEAEESVPSFGRSASRPAERPPRRRC